MLKVSHSIDVRKRAQELGCNIPTSIALLPRNFEISASKEELIHESTTPTVRVLWRQNGITETPLEQPEEKFPFVSEHAFEWIGPTIFYFSDVIKSKPTLGDNRAECYLKLSNRMV